MATKKKSGGRPGRNKTPMEMKLRTVVGLLQDDLERFKIINEKLTKAKVVLENEVSETLEEIVKLGEVQQEQINEINGRLDRLEGKQTDDGADEQSNN